MMNKNIYDVIIIGAGISGLVIAKILKKKGLNILLIEKSKSVGGRMATRRDNVSRYDHGAQFLKFENPELQDIKNELLKENLIKEWFQQNNVTYYASESGMTKIAKYLQADLQIMFSEKAVQIEDESINQIQIICENDQNYFAKNLVLSAPWPQSRDLLKNSKIRFPENLESLNYHQALVGLFELNDQNDSLNQFNYVEKVDENIHSVSNQKSKKVSESNCFTVVMTSAFSKSNFDLPEEIIQKKITEHFSNWLNKQSSTSTILKSQIKKWRYSHPENIHNKTYEVVGSNQNIYLIGDAFGGGSVQGAIWSATQAARSTFSF
jgi:renalase